MPELPEVESIRRSLEPRIVGRTVRNVTLHRRDVLVAPGDPFGGFARQRPSGAKGRIKPVRVGRADLLLGATITALRRRGKQLAITARGGTERVGCERSLVVQLGMSGQLFHRGPGQRVPEPGHIHAVWRLDDGRIIFRDPRRFGGLRAFPSSADLDVHWSTLGPDALGITARQLGAALADVQRALKPALLDQSLIAGVGNIYADEALFAAALAPHRRCSDLDARAIDRLAAAIRTTLARAIEAGGSTLRDYVDADGRPGSYQAEHAVYGRGGAPCTRCGRSLRQSTLGQRTTVWCARCQS